MGAICSNECGPEEGWVECAECATTLSFERGTESEAYPSFECGGEGDRAVLANAKSDMSRYATKRMPEADYDIGSHIGGSVELAVGRCDGRTYAMKTYTKTQLSSRMKASLKREAEIYLSVDHPHIAHLEMVYETSEELFFVMEYMAGGDLFDHISTRGPLAEDVVARFARQILLAIVYLHINDIAHRDLKLENILFEQKGGDHLKMVDLDMAKFAKQNAQLFQADVWSLGAMVFTMLVGCPFVKGACSFSPGVVEATPRFKSLSRPAQDFVKSLLQVDPDCRPCARDALSHEWFRVQVLAEQVRMDGSILGRLKTFARSSSFQRKVLSLMAWSLSPEELECFRKLFLAIDREMSGSVALREFKAVLADSFPMESEQEAEAIFTSLDMSGTGRIAYSDFLAAVIPGNAKGREDLLRRVFARFDRNGDGKVSRGEFKSVLGKSCSAFEIEELFREDKSGEGKLNFKQFQARFNRPGPSRKSAESKARHRGRAA